MSLVIRKRRITVMSRQPEHTLPVLTSNWVVFSSRPFVVDSFLLFCVCCPTTVGTCRRFHRLHYATRAVHYANPSDRFAGGSCYLASPPWGRGHHNGRVSSPSFSVSLLPFVDARCPSELHVLSALCCWRGEGGML